MSKGGSKVEETPQQRALAEHAVRQLDDYKTRWLPVQQRLAQQVQEMGKADSSARRIAEGRSTTDTAVKFAGAQGALEKSLANTAGLGSSRAKLAITGMGEDKATATGLGMTAANQQIDDAYVEALGALAATGRGERAQVGGAMSRQAAASGRQAEADAEAALTSRMGNARVVGQVAGYGLQRWMKENDDKQQQQRGLGLSGSPAFNTHTTSSGFPIDDPANVMGDIRW